MLTTYYCEVLNTEWKYALPSRHSVGAFGRIKPSLRLKVGEAAMSLVQECPYLREEIGTGYEGWVQTLRTRYKTVRTEFRNASRDISLSKKISNCQILEENWKTPERENWTGSPITQKKKMKVLSPNI